MPEVNGQVNGTPPGPAPARGSSWPVDPGPPEGARERRVHRTRRPAHLPRTLPRTWAATSMWQGKATLHAHNPRSAALPSTLTALGTPRLPTWAGRLRCRALGEYESRPNRRARTKIAVTSYGTGMRQRSTTQQLRRRTGTTKTSRRPLSANNGGDHHGLGDRRGALEVLVATNPGPCGRSRPRRRRETPAHPGRGC